jgi:hypothetical protein
MSVIIASVLMRKVEMVADESRSGARRTTRRDGLYGARPTRHSQTISDPRDDLTWTT